MFVQTSREKNARQPILAESRIKRIKTRDKQKCLTCPIRFVFNRGKVIKMPQFQPLNKKFMHENGCLNEGRF